MAFEERALGRHMRGGRYWWHMSDGVHFAVDEPRSEDAVALRAEAVAGAVNVFCAVHCQAPADVELRAEVGDRTQTKTSVGGAGHLVELSGPVTGAKGELVRITVRIAMATEVIG